MGTAEFVFVSLCSTGTQASFCGNNEFVLIKIIVLCYDDFYLKNGAAENRKLSLSENST